MATAQQLKSQTKTAISRKKLHEAKVLKKESYSAFRKAVEGKESSENRLLNLHKAKANIELAIRCNEMDADALNLAGRINLELSSTKDARLYIESAIALDPENAGYWYSLGHISLSERDFISAIEQFRRAIDISPKETRAEISLAYTLAEQGQTVEAFRHYRELAKTHEHDPHIKNKLLDCISKIKADCYDEELEQDLIRYFSWADTNKFLLSSLTGSLLVYKYNLHTGEISAKLKDIASDRLFLLLLSETIVKETVLERLIISLRHEILLDSTQLGFIRAELLPLANAICLFGYHSEFILPILDNETNLVDALQDLILSATSAHENDANVTSGACLLFGMYHPFTKCSGLLSYFQRNQTELEPTLKPVIKEYLDSEKLNKIKIPSLASCISDDSIQVQGQYELHPYPRWNCIEYKRPTQYRRALCHELGKNNLFQHQDTEKLNILVAGCGTGRHAIHLARYFNDVTIKAMDLSYQSLAYAKQKSIFYQINSIDFFQGDILTMTENDWLFDIIECSGVLHHIQNFDKALSNLLTHLKPGGLIKLGLYSTLARRPVNIIRKLWKSQSDPLSHQKMAMIRQAIQDSEEFHDKKGILLSEDFYSMSGCKDLLFHEYEKTLTPLELIDVCQQHNLKMLGFIHLEEKVRSAFYGMFGRSADITDFSLWQIFEEKYPATFSSMYQFYCQYQPKPSLS